jgi:hypothetical protein
MVFRTFEWHTLQDIFYYKFHIKILLILIPFLPQESFVVRYSLHAVMDIQYSRRSIHVIGGFLTIFFMLKIAAIDSSEEGY